jgi:hypothetical protein
MMAETLVRALSPQELAERLRDSDDFATRTLATHLINDYASQHTEQIDALGMELEAVRDRNVEIEQDNEDLKELLADCLDAVNDPDLKSQIKEALR